jgi:hypothetical protein
MVALAGAPLVLAFCVGAIVLQERAALADL